MRYDTLSKCLSVLRKMKTGRDQEWCDSLAEQYAEVLMPIEDEQGKDVVRKAWRMEWRPSPGELENMAIASVMGNIPDAQECIEEIMGMMRKHGRYGYADPENPNCRKEGDPKFSHPIVTRVVSIVGGNYHPWFQLCEWDQTLRGSLEKAIEKAWESASHRAIEHTQGMIERADSARLISDIGMNIKSIGQ